MIPAILTLLGYAALLAVLGAWIGLTIAWMKEAFE